MELEPPEIKQALALRAKWMRTMGIDETEMAAYCDPEKFPVSMREEEERARAREDARHRQFTREELETLANRYPPPPEWYQE